MGIPHGLSFQETKELWVRADLARNGVFDYEKLKVKRKPQTNKNVKFEDSDICG